MSTLLKNGTVIDYASKTNEKLDILIKDGKIVKIEKNISEEADKVIDCINNARNDRYALPFKRTWF